MLNALCLSKKNIVLLLGVCLIMPFTLSLNSLAKTTQDKQKNAQIVLGMGCFWGAEKRLQAIEGVLDAESGYSDGKGIKPSYDVIVQNKHNPDNFAEVVKVTYDPKRTSLQHILTVFFENHDPTQGNRQGNDVGTQYRSTILYTDEAQKQQAHSMAQRYQLALKQAGLGQITTKIAPLVAFFPAEQYHQNYLEKNPNGYCPNHATGVTFSQIKSKKTKQTDNSALLKGKHIVVLEAPYCPYCKKFKQEVSQSYQGSIALHHRQNEQLQNLQLNTPTWATPTIYFIENGKEVYAHQGYMTKDKFYQALGMFKLGKDSESYNIAFNEGTENRFCRQYEQFKQTPDGVFIDKLSGEPLFDTRHRFNSNSGWLSFTQAIPNSTIETADNRFGMQRTEVIAKTSGIHLGHVFSDGPNGARRFCINANVLEFKPRQ